MTPLAAKVLELAAKEIGVRELGRNRGQRIEEYLACVSCPPGNPWCAAFVSFIYEQAAKALGMENPLSKAAAVNKLWRKAPFWTRTKEPTPGSVFIRFQNPDNDYSLGHTGIVSQVIPGAIVTIEGNTDDGGSRDGDGVYLRTRPIGYANMGFIDVNRPKPDAVA